MLVLVAQACEAGARLARACAQIGLSARTAQRWQCRADHDDGDLRASARRVATPPPNRLTDAERKDALALLNSDEFKDLPPSQTRSPPGRSGPLRGQRIDLDRRSERAPQPRSRPRALVARRPDQIYTWDISYLPTDVRGRYFYLYLFIDLFSRKIVGWQVYDSESALRASELLTDICCAQAIAPEQLTLHSDNGGLMKGETMLATLQRLGVAASRSRPAVSNDNPFSEALFRTLKYRPELPLRPLRSILEARDWMTRLVHWHNHEHRHSAIGFVTPEQRHRQIDRFLLNNRSAVYAAARDRHPRRWSGPVRNWAYIDAVHLNPDKPTNRHIPPTPIAT